MGFLFGLGKLFFGGCEVGTIESVIVESVMVFNEGEQRFSVQGSAGSITVPIELRKADILCLSDRMDWPEAEPLRGKLAILAE